MNEFEKPTNCSNCPHIPMMEEIFDEHAKELSRELISAEEIDRARTIAAGVFGVLGLAESDVERQSQTMVDDLQLGEIEDRMNIEKHMDNVQGLA